MKKPLDENNDKCELIGTFSLVTQACLGLLCLSSLIIKRYFEYPLRRTWKVWLFDVLKQLVGALGVHTFNLFLSILKSQDSDGSNNIIRIKENNENDDSACDWYFMNIVLDCTIGVLILYYIFGFVNFVCHKYLGLTEIESGYYGKNPHKPSLKAFFKQLVVYFGSLMMTKVVLYAFLEFFETPLLWFTSNVLLVWLDEYPDNFEIFIVMFVVPIVMNSIQLVLVDNIIQNSIIGKVNHRYQQHEMIEPASDSEEVSGDIEGIEDQRVQKAYPKSNNNNPIRYDSINQDSTC